MLRRRFSRIVAGVAVGGVAAAMLVVGSAPASATPGSTTLVSRAADGSPVPDGGYAPQISPDGSVVLFLASDPDIVPGVQGQHLYAYDRRAGTTAVVDVLPDGSLAGSGGVADMSADGRYVVFDANLYDAACPAPIGDDSTGRRCLSVFRRDLQSDTTVVVSLSDDETTRGNEGSYDATISADGNRVAFDSLATNLAGPGADPDGTVYVRDIAAGTTTMVSVAGDETPANSYSQANQISADGEHVSFVSAATNLGDGHVFVRNLDDGTTDAPLAGLDLGFLGIAMDADASVISFSTSASLLPEDDEGDQSVYVLDRGSDELTVVEPHEFSDAGQPQLSDDGRFVAFRGERSATQGTAPVGVWVHDRASGTSSLESVRTDGSSVGRTDLTSNVMSADARFVLFTTNTDDVTPDDVDGVYDVFVHDRAVSVGNASGTGSASTDSGSGPTFTDTMTTAVSGSPGAVSIVELAPGDAAELPLEGYDVLGQQVKITAAPATPPAFLTFTFDLDASVVPAGGPSGVAVLRNGVALSDCTTVSDPGPCVASRSVLPSGDWRFVAHSPQASVWTVATPIGSGPPPPDTTDPTVDLRAPGNGATYAQGQAVTVDYDCADAGGAGLFSCEGDQADGASLDTSTPGVHSFAVTATDNAGNDSTTSVSYTVQGAPSDTTDPTVTLTRPADGASYVLGSTVRAAYTCADQGGSGLASCSGTRASGATVNTGSIGTKSFTVTATDGAGNTATTTVHYTVVWPLTAFLGPVDNPPVVNTVKAGKIVPVRFSLGGNRGLSVLATGYPQVSTMTCPSGAPTDEIETTLGGKPPTLSYSNGTYTYAFRTSTSWASRTTCRVLTVRWADGQQRSAVFKLR